MPISQKLPPGGDTARRAADRVNRVIEGRTDNYGSVTLTAGAASTTVAAPYVSENSTILLTPRSANAAAEMAAGTMHVSAVSNGSFVITHANNAQTDRTYDFAWIG